MTVPGTEKLYLDDPYTVGFQARVAKCAAGGDRASLVLDRSFFYAESGGQTADTGTIATLVVVDVREEPDGTVTHVVEAGGDASLPAVGDEVECRVDWPRRFDHMQQHTGQHILSRAFVRTAGLATVSFHMGEDACTIDLDGGTPDDAALAAAEDLANEIVVENRPVVIETLPVERFDRLDELDLRRALPEGVTEARLVEVRDFDVVPCCGTHVRATGELGLIKVLKVEKARGGAARVHFKVGGRALRDYRDKHDIVQALGNRLTTSAGDLAARVDKLLDEGQRARKELKRLVRELARHEARALLEGGAGGGRARVVAHYYAEHDDAFAQMVAAALVERAGTVAVIGAGTGAVVCGASKDLAVDFGPTAVEPARAAGGSGGGKGGFARLKLPDAADVGRFVEEIRDNVIRSMS